MSSEIEPKFVRRGLWTNIEDGPVLGRTITTDARNGNLVVAILAIVSTLGTAHLWHLLSFAYHQARANGKPSDALFRQQQALLRTLPTPSAVMADAFKLYWAWRRKADRPFLRSALLVLLAFLFTAGTIAASIFSSLIVKGGTITVLVNSPFCGRANSNPDAGRTFSTSVDVYAGGYAANCYRTFNGTLPASCEVFVQPNIPLKVEDVPCPFPDKKWCDTKDAVSIDSGLQDVGKAFGFNLQAKDRVMQRKKTTCTVLPLGKYYAIYNVEDNPALDVDMQIPNAQVAVLQYGYAFRKPMFAASVVSLTMSNLTNIPMTWGGRTLRGDRENAISLQKFPGQFLPWSQGLWIANNTGDVFYKVVTPNNVRFMEKVDDPLYAAHKFAGYQSNGYQNKTLYAPDYLAKAVGCVQQFQFCHAREGKEDKCTPLQGQPWMEEKPEKIFPEGNSMQKGILELLIGAHWDSRTISAEANKAQRRVTAGGNTIGSIPNGFWKEEVLGWEQESWAGLQIIMAQYAKGAIGSDTPNQPVKAFFVVPDTDGKKALCQAQKMKKSGGFVNINFFGLVFTLTFSLLAMLIDITLLKFLVYLSRFRRALGPRIERWIQDGVWQLQRRAYEGEGQRTWIDLESEIPLMEKPCKLNDLPILWVPGKSPMAMQAATFGSTGSQETLRAAESGTGGLNTTQEQTSASANTRTGSRSRWYMFGRR